MTDISLMQSGVKGEGDGSLGVGLSYREVTRIKTSFPVKGLKVYWGVMQVDPYVTTSHCLENLVPGMSATSNAHYK